MAGIDDDKDLLDALLSLESDPCASFEEVSDVQVTLINGAPTPPKNDPREAVEPQQSKGNTELRCPHSYKPASGRAATPEAARKGHAKITETAKKTNSTFSGRTAISRGTHKLLDGRGVEFKALERETHVQTCSLSGIRVTDRHVSDYLLKDELLAHDFMRIETLCRSVVSWEHFNSVHGCKAATVCVIVEKSTSKTSSGGKRYQIWTLGNLIGTRIKLFLFGAAFTAHWKRSAGSVVCIKGLEAMEPRRSGELPSLKVLQRNCVQLVGVAADYGLCEGNHNQCGNAVNVTKSRLCDYHALEEYKRTNRSRRMEFKTRPSVGMSKKKAEHLKQRALAVAPPLAQRSKIMKDALGRFPSGAAQKLSKRAAAILGVGGNTSIVERLKRQAGIAQSARNAIQSATRVGTGSNYGARVLLKNMEDQQRRSALLQSSGTTSSSSEGIIDKHNRQKQEERSGAVKTRQSTYPGLKKRVYAESTGDEEAGATLPTIKKLHHLESAVHSSSLRGSLSEMPSTSTAASKGLITTRKGPSDDYILELEDEALCRSYDVPLESIFALKDLRQRIYNEGSLRNVASAATKKVVKAKCTVIDKIQASTKPVGGSRPGLSVSPRTEKQRGVIDSRVYLKFLTCRNGNRSGLSITGVDHQVDRVAGPTETADGDGVVYDEQGESSCSGNKLEVPTVRNVSIKSTQRHTKQSSFGSLFGGVPLESARAKSVFEASSELKTEAEDLAWQQSIAKATCLEKQEQVESQLLAMHVVDVTAVRCNVCMYIEAAAHAKCERENHSISRIKTKKRFFVCSGCKKRVHVVHCRLPRAGCEKCGRTAWRPAGMIKDSSHMAEEQYGRESKLKLRGEEHGFSVKS